MYKRAVIGLLVCFAHVAKAQYNSGSLHSNFMPTNSLYINPSSITNAKVWLDINIVGAGSYVNNNYIHLKNHSQLSLIREAIEGRSTVVESDLQYGKNRNRYFAYNRNFVQGPSAVWSQGDWGIGLSTGLRSFTHLRSFPQFIGNFIENGVPDYTVQHNIDYSLRNLKVSSIHFAEIKLTGAYTFYKKGRDRLTAGVNLSKLFSIGGAAVNLYEFDFVVNDDSLTSLINVDADAMYTSQPRFNSRGGFGVDLGFTFERMKSHAASYYPNSPKLGCNYVPYLWKLGVSVMDLGSVKFAPDDVQSAGYQFDGYLWYNYDSLTVDENDAHLIWADLGVDVNMRSVRKPYRVTLPGIVSAQFDWNVWQDRLYVNVMWNQNLFHRRRIFSAKQANFIGVTPRFETAWFEFALPLGLYEYAYPQLGAAVRFGPLTLGSDKILNWFTDVSMYGADFYFHLKIPILRHPTCKERGWKNALPKTKRNRHRVPCSAYG